jgi:site-specific recombinase XerD
MAFSSIRLYKEIKTTKEKYVIIYFQHETILRYRTGIKAKPKDFDSRTSKIKPVDLEYISKNKTISECHKLVEGMIEAYIKENRIKPTGDHIKNELVEGYTAQKNKLSLKLLDCYETYLGEMKIHFNSPDKSSASWKDFKSTQNALIDYQRVLGTRDIMLTDVNNKIWLSKFNQFLAKERPEIAGHKFKSRAQNDKTRHKRFSCIKQFSSWLLDKGLLDSNRELNRFRIKVDDREYYTLHMDEIKLIQSTRFSEPSHQQAVDMFVFGCHTGLRFSDIIRVTKSMVQTINGIQILKFSTQKTRERVEIPLSNKALEILLLHNYNLNLLPSSLGNKYLHLGLAEISSFTTDHPFGNDGAAKPIHDQITFHTARRSFITNLVNANISLNAIMKMTGHKKISTLQAYINSDYQLIKENIRIFNEL